MSQRTPNWSIRKGGERGLCWIELALAREVVDQGILSNRTSVGSGSWRMGTGFSGIELVLGREGEEKRLSWIELALGKVDQGDLSDRISVGSGSWS